jgi:hypothetical protein
MRQVNHSFASVRSVDEAFRSPYFIAMALALCHANECIVEVNGLTLALPMQANRESDVSLFCRQGEATSGAMSRDRRRSPCAGVPLGVCQLSRNLVS